MTAAQTSNARRVVIGVDGSQPSIDALRRGARIAEALGSEITVVISWDYPRSYGFAGGAPTEYRPDTDAADILEKALTEVFGDERPANLTTSVEEGHAAQVLVEASKDASMLVVGSRGHGGFVGLLLGSVSAYCAEHATCTVVVARGPVDA